jgi:acetyl-CoA C-acetyltransferase
MMPVSYYAMMETALRKHQGLSVEQHRDEIASLWKHFSEIAVNDDNAWDRTRYSHTDIRDSNASNRMIAFPYTKRHNSNWHVDQAAGLIFCSIGKARALGISERRWAYPLSGTESNHSTVMSERAQLHRSPAVRLVAERALTLANKRIDNINFIDFYSCFPVAVRIQAVELGLPLAGNYSLTGGMTFGGGPLNNYALQALVRVAEKLREHPQASAYVSSISGMMTKYGASVWTGSAPSRPFCFADVSAEVASADPGVALLENAEGIASIVAYTINFGKDAQGEEMPQRAIVVCDIDAHRAVAFSEEVDVMQRMMKEECCGKEIMLGNNGHFHFSHYDT